MLDEPKPFSERRGDLGGEVAGSPEPETLPFFSEPLPAGRRGAASFLASSSGSL